MPLFADPPDTHPEETAQLWAIVEAAKGTKWSGRGLRSVPSSSKSLVSAASTPVGITPRSSNFIKRVFVPRGIVIDPTNILVSSARSHFAEAATDVGSVDLDTPSAVGATPEPPPSPPTSPSLAQLLVDQSDAFARSVAADYVRAKTLELTEEEYASMAKEYFFKRAPWTEADGEDRQWRAERRLQLVCPPKESRHWFAPPLVTAPSDGPLTTTASAASHVSPRSTRSASAMSAASGPSATIMTPTTATEDWSWDVRADASYWLSLEGFNPNYAGDVENCTFVNQYILLPYFTIEFKRDGKSEEMAIRQVAAASAIALYNRHKLRLQALAAACKPWTRQHGAVIRHYAATILGDTFTFWVLRPLVGSQGEWMGCEMKRLTGARVATSSGVCRAAQWVNEVHRWGLDAHRKNCESDIKCILKKGGVRTSDVGLF